MTMQKTPLLMSRILGRGAILDPDIEVVTMQAEGKHRQTLKQTWDRGESGSPRTSKPWHRSRRQGRQLHVE